MRAFAGQTRQGVRPTALSGRWTRTPRPRRSRRAVEDRCCPACQALDEMAEWSCQGLDRLMTRFAGRPGRSTESFRPPAMPPAAHSARLTSGSYCDAAVLRTGTPGAPLCAAESEHPPWSRRSAPSQRSASRCRLAHHRERGAAGAPGGPVASGGRGERSGRWGDEVNITERLGQERGDRGGGRVHDVAAVRAFHRVQAHRLDVGAGRLDADDL